VSIGLVAASVLTGTPARAVNPQTPPNPDILVTVEPGSGPVQSTFQATVTFSPTPCAPGKVGFYPQARAVWGTNLGPLVTMPSNCLISERLKAPAFWTTPQTYSFYAVYQSTGPHGGLALGRYTITTATPKPSPSARRSSAAPRVVASATGPAVTEDPATGEPNSSAAGVPMIEPSLVAAPKEDAGGPPWSWIGLGVAVLVVTVATVLITRRRPRRATGWRSR
jgi:hypothetical protein